MNGCLKGLFIENLCFQNIGPVNLRVEPGECVGVSGPSGAGKTLFMRAVADMDIHTGNIFLNSVEHSKMPGHEWRKHVGLLPAESCWWHDTVGGHFKQIENLLLEALGFDNSVLNWQISRLSSGERQRLSLLRLLANQPKALLLDEPTANLDPENTIRVEKLLNEYRTENHLPVIWISHDKSQIQRVASRHLIMDKHSLSEV